ncbi:MAG TPA: hypothetical protein VHW64_18575 [Nocardioides sp.]|jgi:hypothetical protein|nr:hypothetical protein [Nocardioides sp.]HEX3932708.1 hypothetical protein [Nocardioides sp.]
MAEQANNLSRTLTPLWARQRRYRVRLAVDGMVRRNIALTA